SISAGVGGANGGVVTSSAYGPRLGKLPKSLCGAGSRILRQACSGHGAQQLRHPGSRCLHEIAADRRLLLWERGRIEVVVDEVDHLAWLDVVQALTRLRSDERRVLPALLLLFECCDLVGADLHRRFQRGDLLALVDEGT